MNLDMSPRAITARLKLVSQITRACLFLRNAKLETKKEESPPLPDKITPEKTYMPSSKTR